jgi:hypothetical protein
MLEHMSEIPSKSASIRLHCLTPNNAVSVYRKEILEFFVRYGENASEHKRMLVVIYDLPQTHILQLSNSGECEKINGFDAFLIRLKVGSINASAPEWLEPLGSGSR